MDPNEVPDEDDFDAYNDETFGDDGVEFSWPDGTNNDIFSETFQGRNGIPASRNEKMLFSEENDYGIENDMEESISRLVLDDEADPGADIKAQRLANTHAYFMPPQVVNKNLNWFMEKDLPGGSSLLGSSVWSMHPTAAAPPPPVQPSRRENEHLLARDETPSVRQVEGRNSSMDQGLNRPPPGLVKENTTGRPVESSNSLHKAKTLDEIEREYFKAYNDKGSTQVTSTPQERARVESTEALRQVLMPENNSNTSAVTRRIEDYPRPGTGYAISDDRVNYEANYRPPPGLGHHPNNMSSQMNHYQFNPPDYPYPMIPPMMAAYRHGIRMHMPPPPMNHRPAYNNNGNYFSVQNVHPQGHHVHMQVGQSKPTNRDPFAGLMNNQNKQRLKNIQIVQLQNDHPYRTDYYYQMRTYKNTKDMGCLRRLFPRKDEAQTKNEYEPTKFENALGKLQAVSALAPKRIFDTQIGTNSSTFEVTYPSLRPRLLWEIEKLYSMFLDIKEVDFRIKAGTIGSYQDRQSGEALYTKLYDIVNKNDARLVDWLKVPKARALLFDFVVFLTSSDMHQDDSYSLFGKILQAMDFTTLKKLEKNNEDWALYRKVEDMIQNCTTKQVDILLQALPDYFFESRLGSSIYFSVLQTAAVACLENETTQFYVSNYALNLYLTGRTQEERSNHLAGFQRIPKLVEQLVRLENKDVASILLGRGRIDVKPLLELMTISSVRDAHNRMLHLRAEFRYRVSREPKNNWIDEFYADITIESDPMMHYIGP